MERNETLNYVLKCEMERNETLNYDVYMCEMERNETLNYVFLN